MLAAMMNRTLKTPVPWRWVLLVIALFTAGCAATGGSTDETTERPSGSEISGDQIRRSGERTVEEILQGRVSGVTVMPAPGGGFQLRIRGASTFNGSNEPLILIDGVPLAKGYRGSIPVSPYDIDSIKVLKNATDLAFYGVRGANGVILITTKRGS